MYPYIIFPPTQRLKFYIGVFAYEPIATFSMDRPARL